MTHEQKMHLAQNVFPVMAELTGRSFSTHAIIMMVDSLHDLDYDQVIKVLNDWGKTEKTFPHPSDIRAKVMPGIDDKDNALEVASTVIAAIGRFGYTNPKSAQIYIGPLGWEVVDRMGGWKHMCETCTHGNENTLRSQIRTFAETVSKRAKRGELDQRPGLPESQAVKNIMNGTFKSIEHISDENEAPNG